MDSSSWPGFFASAAVHTSGQGFSEGDWILVLILIAALILAATSAAAETALTSVNRIKLRNLAEEGDAKAKRVARVLEKPQTFLSTILVVSNVSVIVASTVSTLLAIHIFTDYGDVISTVLLSLFVLIFCEITPKTAAVQAPERWARVLVGPVEALSALLRPVVTVLTFITTNIVRLFGGQPVRHGPFVTEEELRLLVEVGEEEGVLEEEEREMIHNVFELADTAVREVMVPRIDMVTVEADATVDEAMDLIVQGGQSRIPVYEDSIDNIIGVLYAKDLLRIFANHQHPATVHSLVRPAYFVPESKRLDDLLRELQQQRVHMAIVVDEYGSVAGLVTIEDLVEEIIGDIQDEYDKEEQLFEKVSENEYIVDAKISLTDFNELLDTDLTSEDYETLGGFVYAQLDKIPTVGDIVRFENLTITVLSTKGRRVTKVKVVRAVESEVGGPEAIMGEPLPAPDGPPALPPPPLDEARDTAGRSPDLEHVDTGVEHGVEHGGEQGSDGDAEPDREQSKVVDPPGANGATVLDALDAADQPESSAQDSRHERSRRTVTRRHAHGSVQQRRR